MTERYGYWNKVLHVDLGAGETWIEEPGDQFFRLHGGGRNLIAHYLLTLVPPGIDPLSPENVLVFAPGVLTGAPVPGAGRHSVGAKSPLTGAFGEAEAGGFWGAELKRAGWDGIVVHGAAEHPIYLWIRDGEVEIRDASHLWGKLTGDVEDLLLEELGDPRIRVAQCGLAGENLVRFALVENDLNEVAGRTGLGAVMGSKKLKAIAVRGNQQVPVADKAKLIEIAKWVSGTLDQNHTALHEYGTGAGMQGKNLEGGMPSSNYRYGRFDGTPSIDAMAVAEDGRIEMKACYACSVRCKKVVQIERRAEDAGTTKKGKPIGYDHEGRWRVDPRYGGPEYESLAALGANLGVDDLVAVLKSNELCNALGMDTISAGATIAWAAECYEKGIITKEDTDGLAIEFRDGNTVVQLLEMIARREGFGDLLAEGSHRAAQKLGRGSEDLVVAVKGLEVAMHDPRHMDYMRASYLLAPTGGDHLRQTGEKNGLRNQVGMCIFLAYDDPQMIDIMNAVSGWNLTQEDVVEMAHRGLTMTRLFNLREGFGRKDDRLPARFTEDLPMHKGLTWQQMDEIVQEYYASQGWDVETGVPRSETLESLGLAQYAPATA